MVKAVTRRTSFEPEPGDRNSVHADESDVPVLHLLRLQHAGLRYVKYARGMQRMT